MNKPKLLIKYQGEYLCEFEHNEYSLIHVPTYFDQEPFSNISIFISLLLTGIIEENYYAKMALDYAEGLKRMELSFLPEFLTQISKETFFYDVDKLLACCDDKKQEYIITSLARKPKRIVLVPLENINENKKLVETKINQEEQKSFGEGPFIHKQYYPFINSELEFTIKNVEVKRGPKDVLLLYSGGKDSTLAALRLVQEGYHVYFLHFDNGAMRDSDKPFLTWQKTFSNFDGYYFPYEYSSVNIEQEFASFFKNWQNTHQEKPQDGTITSEIRCLACRSAIYFRALQIARQEGFHYLAEGARSSQKFMIEQIPMITRFQEIARKYNVEVLYPVLYLNDDKVEIQELLANDFSAKSWESKCLLGREAMNKTKEDEARILSYYDEIIKPKF